MNGDSVVITIREGVNGRVHCVTKFDPPLDDEVQEAVLDDDFDNVPPLVGAATAAVGAVGNYLAGLDH
jgi:hypothetical protein